MTTHEALELQPNTAVHCLPALLHDNQRLDGVASPQHPQLIRIRWISIAEVDSVISILDRILLSSIIIAEPLTEQDLGKNPAPNH